MNASENILEENPDKITERAEFLQLGKKGLDGRTVSTGPHLVTLLRDEKGYRDNIRTHQREEVIWFYVDEKGVEKKYAVPIFDKKGNVHYLIQRLGKLPEGTKVILEYKKKPNSFEGYIDVKEADENMTQVSESEGDNSELPVLEEEG